MSDAATRDALKAEVGDLKPIVVKRRRNRKRTVAPPPQPAAAPVQPPHQIADAIVDEEGEFDQAAADAEKRRLAKMVTWTVPKTATGDPIVIANAVRTWKLWPQQQYRTPLGVMLSAMAQAGVNAQMEAEHLQDRGNAANGQPGDFLGRF